MKRTLILILLAILSFPPTVTAQAKTCPRNLRNIRRCPVTGCGGRAIDQNLNRRKNIRADDNTPIRRTLQWIKNRPNPENFVKGGSRAELFTLGEGGAYQGCRLPAGS